MPNPMIPTKFRHRLRIISFWAGIATGVILFLLKMWPVDTVLSLAAEDWTDGFTIALITLVIFYVVSVVEDAEESQNELKDQIKRTHEAQETAIRALEMNRADIQLYDTFDEGASVWVRTLQAEGDVEELLICAFTAMSFWKAVRNFRVGSLTRVKLLLFIQQGKLSREGRPIDVGDAVNQWRDLVSPEPYIQHLEVRRIGANPQLYLGIADGASMLLGFLLPFGSQENLHTDRCIVIKRSHLISQQMIERQIIWFNKYWELAESLLPPQQAEAP
jgi:hypothetical protein